MNIHELKTWPEYFEQVYNGTKTFEVRRDDRGFKIGDQLRLREYDQVTKSYSGRQCLRNIVCIVVGGQFGIEKGNVVMGLETISV